MPINENELRSKLADASRLRALAQLDLLGNPPLPGFERLARLGARLIHAQTAEISLLDDQFQYIQSMIGAPKTIDASQPFPVHEGFCQYVVGSGEPLQIDDAGSDPRFIQHPAYTKYGVVSYLGFPIEDRDHEVLGTVCFFDRQPHRWSEEERQIAAEFAEVINTELNLHREMRAHEATLEALRESEQRYRLVVNTLDEGLVLQHADGTILASNSSAERILGLSADQIAGRTSLDPRWQAIRPDGSPFPGDEHPAMISLRTAAPCTDVTMGVQKPDGSLSWILINAQPLIDLKSEEAYAVVVSFVDITKRKAYEDELRMLSLVASRTSTGVVIANREGLIEWVNSSFEEITGYSREELIGRHPGRILQGPATDLEVVRRIRAALHQGRESVEEVLNYRKDGSTYWVLIHITPIADQSGQINRYIAVETDISARKELERLKDEFIGVVSHELRTPLTSISGSLGLIAGGVAGPLPERAAHMVEIAHRNSERLIRLINDMLDIEKIASGSMKLRFRPLELRDLVANAVEATRAYANHYGVQLDFLRPDAPCWVEGDSDRLIQVLTNLFSNAIKFSSSGQVVAIVIAPLNREQVAIHVRDQGAGIPLEFQARIFQRFAQADSSSARAREGTGLGLSIAQALVREHRGELSFVSELGQGTIFTVMLPQIAAP